MKINEKYKKYFYKKELVKIVHLLDELNKNKYTKDILRHLANDNIDSGSEILAAELATNISRYDFAIQLSKLASYEKRFHNDFNYPIISTPKYVNKRKIPESALILSIIRQESEFDMSANSHAGAKGLMQLIPYTAKLVSKQAKLPYSKSRLTSDPEYNINLGSHYIAGLILEYDGAYPFAIAAYNAGPTRVRRAINANKAQGKPTDFWSLNLPLETTAYIPKLLVLSELIQNPEKYSVTLPSIQNRPYFVKVDLPGQIDLMQAADLAGMKPEAIYELNPGFSQWANFYLWM
jgi:soluble lytic murein transglycosylase